MSAIRRRWRFTGTVQGVGFRYYARAAALHLGLTGWVANNWDGSVTLEAQGERAMGILIWPAAFVLPNALRAANDVKFTMIVSIASMACWRVGFSYIIGVRMGMGAIGVWIAMVVDWVCRVTCFVTRFRSGVWKEKYKA